MTAVHDTLPYSFHKLAQFLKLHAKARVRNAGIRFDDAAAFFNAIVRLY